MVFLTPGLGLFRHNLYWYLNLRLVRLGIKGRFEC